MSPPILTNHHPQHRIWTGLVGFTLNCAKNLENNWLTLNCSESASNYCLSLWLENCQWKLLFLHWPIKSETTLREVRRSKHRCHVTSFSEKSCQTEQMWVVFSIYYFVVVKLSESELSTHSEWDSLYIAPSESGDFHQHHICYHIDIIDHKKWN